MGSWSKAPTKSTNRSAAVYVTSESPPAGRQEQLAEKLQVDPKDIYAYEKGAKRITADRLLRLSKVLGVKPVYFFGFEDNERPANREAARLTLPDQGLRLHRAFIGVKSPALREAIVSLVTELARNETPCVAQSCIDCATHLCKRAPLALRETRVRSLSGGESEFLRFRRLDSEFLTERVQSLRGGLRPYRRALRSSWCRRSGAVCR